MNNCGYLRRYYNTAAALQFDVSINNLIFTFVPQLTSINPLKQKRHYTHNSEYKYWNTIIKQGPPKSLAMSEQLCFLRVHMFTTQDLSSPGHFEWIYYFPANIQHDENATYIIITRAQTPTWWDFKGVWNFALTLLANFELWKEQWYLRSTRLYPHSGAYHNNSASSFPWRHMCVDFCISRIKNTKLIF